MQNCKDVFKDTSGGNCLSGHNLAEICKNGNLFLLYVMTIGQSCLIDTKKLILRHPYEHKNRKMQDDFLVDY